MWFNIGHETVTNCNLFSSQKSIYLMPYLKYILDYELSDIDHRTIVPLVVNDFMEKPDYILGYK